MSLTLLNIMEQVGSRQTKLIAQYVNDALEEIAFEIPDKVERSKIDVVADTRYYSLPSTMKNLKGVYQKDTTLTGDTVYVKTSRIQNVDIIQDDNTASTETNDDDIIII